MAAKSGRSLVNVPLKLLRGEQVLLKISSILGSKIDDGDASQLKA